MANLEEAILCKQCSSWKAPGEFTLVAYDTSNSRPLCKECASFNTVKAQEDQFNQQVEQNQVPVSPLSKHFSQDWGFMDRAREEKLARDYQIAQAEAEYNTWMDTDNKVDNTLAANIKLENDFIELKKRLAAEYQEQLNKIGNSPVTSQDHVEDTINETVPEPSIYHKGHYAIGDKDLYSHFIESFGFYLWLRHVEMEAIQYLQRARYKGSYKEDISKVIDICKRILVELESQK